MLLCPVIPNACARNFRCETRTQSGSGRSPSQITRRAQHSMLLGFLLPLHGSVAVLPAGFPVDDAITATTASEAVYPATLITGFGSGP